MDGQMENTGTKKSYRETQAKVTAIAAASTSAIDLTLTHLPMFWFPFVCKKFEFWAVVHAVVFMIFWLPFIHSASFWKTNTHILMDPTNHRVHHCWGRKNNYNFGGYTLIWDKLMGTYPKNVLTPS